MTHHRRTIDASGAPAAVGPYSQAVLSNGLLFCSGQIPLDPESDQLIGGGAGEQAVRCLQNLAAVCESAGASLSDAVRLTVFLTDLDGDWADVNQAYESFFDSDPPARAAVGVAALPEGARVEIDAVVALPD
jgi:2-iminobutanoate/2-iminopropanoate deaminase